MNTQIPHFADHAIATRYDYSPLFVGLLRLVTMAISFSFLFLIYHHPAKFSAMDGFIYAAFALFISLAIATSLSYMSIGIGPAGISVYFLMFKIRNIGWSEIKKIVKSRVYNGYFWVNQFSAEKENAGFLNSYIVNIFGNIVFNEDIRSLRNLLDQINQFAVQYNITLVTKDLQTNAVRLRNPGELRRRRRGADRAPEVRVEQF